MNLCVCIFKLEIIFSTFSFFKQQIDPAVLFSLNELNSVAKFHLVTRKACDLELNTFYNAEIVKKITTRDYGSCYLVYSQNFKLYLSKRYNDLKIIENVPGRIFRIKGFFDTNFRKSPILEWAVDTTKYYNEQRASSCGGGGGTMADVVGKRSSRHHNDLKIIHECDSGDKVTDGDEEMEQEEEEAGCNSDVTTDHPMTKTRNADLIEKRRSSIIKNSSESANNEFEFQMWARKMMNREKENSKNDDDDNNKE